MPMNDETKAALQSLRDEVDDSRNKRLQCLEAKFKNYPESLTDRDRLELIGLLIHGREFEHAYEKLVTQLSFVSKAIDSEDVRTAWKDFLVSGAIPEEWNSKCDGVMARCFEELEKPIHSVSVYEYMLAQMIGGDPDYRDYAEECLLGLFEHYFQGKPSRRAHEILTLITTYSENGFISDDRYYAVLRRETELFCREKGEALDRDRHLARERLRLEMMQAFDKLHAFTTSHLIDAELWSQYHMRQDEPAAGPRRWALAVEAEFHHKVYATNRKRLDEILGETRRPKGRRTCGIGQVLALVEETAAHPIRRPLIEREIPVWCKLLAVRDIVGTLRIIKKHRDQIAHITDEGIYTQAQCNEFVRKVRESGWIVEFLSSLQSPS